MVLFVLPCTFYSASGLIVMRRLVSHICEETLGFLKQTKHKAWRDSMLGIFGNCAKAFIPSLKQGLITHMCVHSLFLSLFRRTSLARYDHQMFVDHSPAGSAYIIINDKGDKVSQLKC